MNLYACDRFARREHQYLAEIPEQEAQKPLWQGQPGAGQNLFFITAAIGYIDSYCMFPHGFHLLVCKARERQRLSADAPAILLSGFLLHGRQVSVRFHQLVDEQPAGLGPVGVDGGVRGAVPAGVDMGLGVGVPALSIFLI